MTAHVFTRLRLAFQGLLLAVLLAQAMPASAACSVGACITAGPRLASVSTTQSALLNPLLGGLLGSSLNLSVSDWNALAQGDVKLLGMLNALQATANVSSPAQALGAGVTLGQIAAALEAQARAQANTSLAGVLALLRSQLGSATATVRLSDLLKVSMDSGALADTTVNALDMLTGLVQLYNYRNVVSTPKPVGISGGALGMAGVINSLQLYAQVIEPPVYVCGPATSTFHSAAVRTKLKLDLVTLSPATTLLTALPGVYAASIAIGKLDVYVEVARAEGSLAAVDATTRAVTLQVSPGVTDIYIGGIEDGVFFNRSRSIQDADVGFGNVGALALNSLNVAIEVRSIVRGQGSLLPVPVTMSGTFPQTTTVSSSTAFVTNAANSLVNKLELRTTPSLGLLDVAVLPVLRTVVSGALTPVLAPVLTGVADPLLQLLGIGLGQAQVTVHGICQACDDFKLTKTVDKPSALPGSVITYTIVYQNTGTTTLNNLAIADATPPFTTYASGACGTLAAGLGACAIAAQPAAGATGPVRWQFTGTLAPGASGTVSMSVLVQ
ncbi:hypothetical protein [uncultured Massilia sp.]|uniref:DUF7507 domain-containing protein n=1 Tax=uncultured Massilia sp. TaxID=169973 RepID=UPI002588F7A9|nr:hypothetical protein [uncultured Massilia sp.]